MVPDVGYERIGKVLLHPVVPGVRTGVDQPTGGGQVHHVGQIPPPDRLHQQELTAAAEGLSYPLATLTHKNVHIG